MRYLVGNPEDRFFHNEARLKVAKNTVKKVHELHREKRVSGFPITLTAREDRYRLKHSDLGSREIVLCM